MRTCPLTAPSFLSAVMLLSVASAANAGSFYIDFGNQSAAPPSTYGAVLQPGAWDKVGLGTTSSLNDVTGATTTTLIVLSADVLSGGNGCGSSNTCNLRNDNFYASPGHSWDVTFNNLDNGNYDLYYYAPTNQNVPTDPFTANGVAAGSILGSADATLVQGSDWDMIRVSVTNGSLDIFSAQGGYHGLAGLQLTGESTVPEPASFLLIGPALAGIWLTTRRTKR